MARIRASTCGKNDASAGHQDVQVVSRLTGESGLLGDAEDEETKDGDESVDGGDVSNDETAGEENARPPQIDTGAQLSQPTLNQLFGSESKPEMELSQTAVSRAFDVSPSELEAAESQPDLAVNLQMLSNVSGGESEGAREDSPEVNLVQQADVPLERVKTMDLTKVMIVVYVLEKSMMIPIWE
ncbi:hypothetical protein PHMEG_00014661 [Phytophthora megakarya]|uniref:Uncharacterized protein n=1 Tax=Phytophthora megakarya TaxID=4795 RepID=A0A225W3R5_9STRA|nr:hypothetical protein PHMEG_00014661 [Phytophthora megakarya]